MPPGPGPAPGCASSGASGVPRRVRSITNPARATMSSSLAELRGLEAEVGKLDPAAGAPGRGAEEQHQADRADHQRVDADPDLAEARVVDLGHREHQGDADQRVDPLANREEKRLTRDIVGRRDGEGEAAEGDQGEGGAEQPAVEVRQVEAFADASPPRGERERCCFHGFSGRLTIKRVAPRSSRVAPGGAPSNLRSTLTSKPQGSDPGGSCCHHSCVFRTMRAG